MNYKINFRCPNCGKHISTQNFTPTIGYCLNCHQEISPQIDPEMIKTEMYIKKINEVMYERN